MAQNFHVGVPIRNSFGSRPAQCQCECSAPRSQAQAKPKFNEFEKRLRRAILADRKNNGITVGRSSLPCGRGPRRTSAAPIHANTPRDRERARAFMPEATLLGVLARTNPDAAVRVAAAMTERRALAVKAANYEPALPGTPQ